MTASLKNRRKIPSQSRSKERVELIIRSTEKLLLSTSLIKISTSRIAHEAGIPVGSVYQYFQDRDSVLLALAEQVIEQEDYQMEQVFTDVSARAHWRHVVNVVIDAYVRLVLEGQVHFRLAEALASSHEWQRIIQNSERRSIQNFAKYSLFADRNIEENRAIDIARTIVLATRANIEHARNLEDRAKQQHIFDETKRMIVSYLASIFGD